MYKKNVISYNITKQLVSKYIKLIEDDSYNVILFLR